MTDHDADVIVVGCGPVGVMLALRCAQRGMKVIAVDRSTEVYPLPRAIGMDEEIQQLFARAGLLDDLRKHSTPMLGAEFVNASGERVVGIDLPEGTVGALGHPPIVAFDQPRVERFLRHAAIEAGVDIRLGLEALSIEPTTTTGGVRVELTDSSSGSLTGGASVDLTESASGSTIESLTARWLVGADGAKSTIRSQAGISLVDQGFDQTWLVVDATLLDPELALPSVARQICDPARISTFVPGHDSRRRWEFRLRADETREQVLEDAFIADLLAPWGRPDQLQVDRAAVYRFHATVADRFRRGPVFLAGDAAHQMPPFNGQGMCTGMRDAENLSWKLAMVNRGQAGEQLLDTYEAERLPHAEAQVAHAVDAGLLISAIADDGEAALESGYGQRPFPSLGDGRGQEQGLIEGSHPAVGRPLPEPMPGHTVDELGPGWTILCAEADAASIELPRPWRSVGAAVISVADGAYLGLVQSGMVVLVRPDRYVAAITSDLTATTAGFADHLGPSFMQPDPTEASR